MAPAVIARRACRVGGRCPRGDRRCEERLRQSDRADASILEAMRLLERLLMAAEERGRTGSVIEILALQALAHQVQGDVRVEIPSVGSLWYYGAGVPCARAASANGR